MATYNNDLRLKEIATGDESGTWGTSTNTNISLIADGFSFGTKAMAGDSDETFTMPNAASDPTRSFYLKITSGASLTATRTVTLGPNTVSKMWMIENATSGSQTINIKQGSGAVVAIATGEKTFLYTDGGGAGAIVALANPTETGVGTVTNVAVTGTVNGITLTGGPITSTGTFTLGGTLANVSLTSQVTGILPVGNGGIGASSLTANSVVLGNGTGAVQVVAPGVNGNILKSNGTTWTSSTAGALEEPVGTGVSQATTVSGQFWVATAGGITITLPVSASANDFLVIKDGTGAAATTTFLVARNGHKIASSATDLTFDKNFAQITLVYVNPTIGWSV
tara:strand:+ start:742 stop:1755 length:1014 start_codon:yes stop_codon:yes gene_type:complete